VRPSILFYESYFPLALSAACCSVKTNEAVANRGIQGPYFSECAPSWMGVATLRPWH